MFETRIDRSHTGLLQVLAGVALLGIAVLGVARTWASWQGLDSEIYAQAGHQVVDGLGIYDYELHGYGFTYPPFAALLFAPLGLMPLKVGADVMMVVSLVALVVASHCLHRALLPTRPPGECLVFALAAVLTYPVGTSLLSGQIDTVVLALVVADLLPVRTRWPRGLLLGIAISLKLTPAVFLLYLVLRRDVRAALVTAATAAGIALVSALVRPDDAWFYWTSGVLDASRVGKQGAPLNQSLAGLVARAAGTPDGLEGAGRVVWAVLAVLVVAGGAVLIRSALRDERIPDAVAVNAVVGLLISPISWVHHWVWAPIIVLVLVVRAAERRSRLLIALALAGLPWLYTAPQWLLGPYFVIDGERSWGPVEQALGSGLVLWGLASMLALGRAGRSVRTSQYAGSSPRGVPTQ